jgi:hypothetical protein
MSNGSSTATRRRRIISSSIRSSSIRSVRVVRKLAETRVISSSIRMRMLLLITRVCCR